MVLHLLAVPAGADPEEDPAAREVVEARDLLRADDGVALDHQADSGPDEDSLGYGRHLCERHEWVVGMAVVVRKVAAAGIRSLPAGGDVRVLGEQEALEAVLLRQPPELGGRDRVVRREHRQADLHLAPLRLPPEVVSTPQRRTYCAG